MRCAGAPPLRWRIRCSLIANSNVDQQLRNNLKSVIA
jgi:hypothetical protein